MNFTFGDGDFSAFQQPKNDAEVWCTVHVDDDFVFVKLDALHPNVMAILVAEARRKVQERSFLFPIVPELE